MKHCSCFIKLCELYHICCFIHQPKMRVFGGFKTVLLLWIMRVGHFTATSNGNLIFAENVRFLFLCSLSTAFITYSCRSDG